MDGSAKRQAPRPVPFLLLARHSGKCLDVEFASHDDGAAVHQWTAVGGENQRWNLEACEEGYFRIVARHSGKCLDVALASGADGATVHQWSWVGATHQQWRITPFDLLHCAVTARHSGKCLQIGDGPYRGEGARASQLDFSAGDNQLWLVLPDLASYPGPLRIASKLTCQYLGGERSGQRFLLADGGAGPSWRWRSEPSARGARLVATSPAGEQVPPHSGTGGGGWYLRWVGDLVYAIVTASDGNCLEVVDRSARSEVVCRDRFQGRDSQCWYLIPDVTDSLVRGTGADVFLIPDLLWVPLRASSRVLVPDSGDLVGDAWVDERAASELETIPLWPYLPVPPPPVFGSVGGAGDGLIRAACRAAFWLPRYRLGEPVPDEIRRALEANELGRAVPSRRADPTESSRPTAVLAEEPSGRVFLSYSGADRPLARRIAGDLRAAGIPVWMDSWEIAVGDSVSEKIEEGLSGAAFVAVLLTRTSVRSGWVAKEWRSRIAGEAEKRRLSILPLRGDDCEIPVLLRDRKYADFAADYRRALDELVRAVRTRSGLGPEEVAGEAAAPRLRFVTEGGTSTLFFLLANPSAGEPVVLSGVAGKSRIDRDVYSGVGRIDLSALLAHPADPEQRVGALNLSTGDFHLLVDEALRIEPGEVVPFSVRMCCDGWDSPRYTRLILRLVGPDGDDLLPSDCVYLLRAGEPVGTEPPEGMLRRVLIEGSVPVARVLRSPEHEIELLGRRITIPEDLLRDVYRPDDLRWTDLDGRYPNLSLSE